MLQLLSRFSFDVTNNQTGTQENLVATQAEQLPPNITLIVVIMGVVFFLFMALLIFVYRRKKTK